MVLLTMAALGSGAKQLLDYNRSTYKYDRKQEIETTGLGIELQLKRYELFREDIRDLVKLTIDRMDVYHLVGALFLQFCIVILTKGRVQASAPPFLLSLFLLTNASAFIYLLLAVWMSMHASIASHSFGVRLLTRFVRLPIPGAQELRDLTFKFKDFEKKGVASLLQLPFAGRRKQAEATKEVIGSSSHEEGDGKEEAAEDGGLGTDLSHGVSGYLSTTDGKGAPRQPTVGKPAGISREETPRTGNGPGPVLARPVQGAGVGPGGPGAPAAELLPQRAMDPLGGEDLLSGSSGALPERHVQLFRQLQAKWQCYDAYCRVCMGLGVNQMLQVLSYYSICHTVVENNSPSTGFAMVALFQCTTVAVSVLDLAGFKSREIIAVQVVGMLPCFLTIGSLSRGTRSSSGVLDPGENYALSPLSFLFTVLWLELWLRVAAPAGSDGTKLPRRFRQVLFLDVFGDDAGMDDLPVDPLAGAEAEASPELGEAGARAERLAALARGGLRRWRAVPGWALSLGQRRELQVLQEQAGRWMSALQAELERRRPVPEPEEALPTMQDAGSQHEVNEPDSKRSADPFAGCLMGPFSHDGVDACYYYDLESQQTLFSDDPSRVRPGVPVLDLKALTAIIRDLESEVRHLLEIRITRDLRTETKKQREHQHQRSRRSNPLSGPKSTAAASFPNLVSLAKAWRGSTSPKHRHTMLPATVVAQEPASEESTAVPEGDSEVPGEQTDQTLRAVAGENAQHFVPERLPWLLVRGMTRVLQLCWFWAGFMAILREIDLYTIDFGVQVLSEDPMGDFRRLCAAGKWMPELVEVTWPHGSFFRPHGLLCPSTTKGSLLISSTFGFHAVDTARPGPLLLKEVQRRRLPMTTFVLCGSWLEGVSLSPYLGDTPCVAAAVVDNGVSFWPVGEEPPVANKSGSRVEGAVWRLAAGAVVRCENVTKLLPAARNPAEWCLLVAGWDGAALPIAAVPLASEHGQWLNTRVPMTPGLNVPFSPRSTRDHIVSLHVGPLDGRLLALLASGHIEAWDIFTLRSLGRWKLTWPNGAASDTKPVSFCKDSRHWLFVLGQSNPMHPVLARTHLPEQW